MSVEPPPFLVAVDLDGTLLDEHQGVRDADREAIARFRRRGGKLVLATGRLPPMALPFAHDLDLDEPIICANGAWVGTPERRRIFSQQFAEPQLQHLLAVCRSESFRGRVVAFTEEFGYVTELSSRMETYQRERNAPLVVSPALEEGESTPLLKLLFYVDGDELAILRERFVGPLAACEVRVGRPNSLPGFSDVVGVEVSPPGVDKCSALERLAQVLGICRERVATVGDGSNDAAMLAWADQGFAVADGDDAAIEAADQVVGGGDLPPVADALDRFVEQLLS